jgi:hypothetical protein
MDERPSYFKAAFFNVYNLGMVGGAVAASLLTGEYVLGAVALGAEALWLLFGPDLRPFQRAVNNAHREEQEKAERERVEKMMNALPERERARAYALNELRREIERDMQQNPSFQTILIQAEVDKLSTLLKSFVSLATACTRAETYLASSDTRDVNKQIEIHKNLERSHKDAAAQNIARKNIQVLEKRLETMEEIKNFLARARGQMNLIDNTVRLLRDQVLTMASPDQLGEQLNDLISGVNSIQEYAREHEDLFGSKTGIEPITPIENTGSQASRDRVRG